MEKLTLEKFRVDITNPIHQQHFAPEENGAEYEIVSLRRFCQVMVEQGKNIKMSNLEYAIDTNRLHVIHVNNEKLIVLSPKSLSLEKMKKGNDGTRKTIANMRYNKEKPLPFRKIITQKGTEIIASKGQDFYESYPKGGLYALVDKTTETWEIIRVIKKAIVKETI